MVGHQWVDRTTTERLEELFGDMADRDYATSTIDRTWDYLNQACHHAQRARRIKTNPADDVLLPARRPSKPRKSLTLDQVEKLITENIPADPRPAMWLTGLMCGLRPGELAGLRWPSLDIDSDEPSLNVSERAVEVEDRYVGQSSPKTDRGNRRMALHPLCAAALVRHREEQQMLGLYEDEGFVFPTRNGTPMTMSNLRRDFKILCKSAGLGDDWTTYELRHSFVSLVSDQLDDLVKVADLAGHVDTRTTDGYRHSVRSALLLRPASGEPRARVTPGRWGRIMRTSCIGTSGSIFYAPTATGSRTLRNARPGLTIEPDQHIVVGNEDAEQAVARVVSVDDDGVVLVAVLPGPAEDHLDLLRPESAPASH